MSSSDQIAHQLVRMTRSIENIDKTLKTIRGDSERAGRAASMAAHPSSGPYGLSREVTASFDIVSPEIQGSGKIVQLKGSEPSLDRVTLVVEVEGSAARQLLDALEIANAHHFQISAIDRED